MGRGQATDAGTAPPTVKTTSLVPPSLNNFRSELVRKKVNLLSGTSRWSRRASHIARSRDVNCHPKPDFIRHTATAKQFLPRCRTSVYPCRPREPDLAGRNAAGHVLCLGENGSLARGTVRRTRWQQSRWTLYSSLFTPRAFRRLGTAVRGDAREPSTT